MSGRCGCLRSAKGRSVPSSSLSPLRCFASSARCFLAVWPRRYLLENEGWLNDHLESFLEDDYLLFDCPGQVELYSHVPVLKRVSHLLQKHGFNVCGVYLVDALFVTDASKLISGNLMALSAMVHFELPHVNVLSKCDLLLASSTGALDSKDKGAGDAESKMAVLERYLTPSGDALVSELNKAMGPRFKLLNESLAKVLDEYSLVSFVPLDITDEDSIETLMLQVDHAIQYGEDMEPKEPKEFDGDGGGSGSGGEMASSREDYDDDDKGEEEDGEYDGGQAVRDSGFRDSEESEAALDARLRQAERNAARAATGEHALEDGFYGASRGRGGAGAGGAAGRTMHDPSMYFR